MERTIAISGDMIRLGQLLKLAGISDAGADAKALIAGGHVAVNGAPELRRGRQLRAGDLIEVGSEAVRVAAGPA